MKKLMIDQLMNISIFLHFNGVFVDLSC